MNAIPQPPVAPRPPADPAAFRRRLIDAAAQPYRRAGRFASHWARGKLAGDPAFVHILQHGLLAGCRRILDLGCGQGLLAAWLLAARRLHAAGDWPANWPAPPATGSLRGIELMAADVERARAALGADAEFVAADMCEAPFGEADAVVILDVLHYVPVAAQDRVLARIRDALPAGGTLLLRIGDAAGGLPFRISNWVDHVVTFARGHRLSRLHCRPLADWRRTLEGLGFVVDSRPMSAGTPFANVMLIARLSEPAADRR
jgi:SAM-dependent methyltransferase